jgi:ankyrin repeat protein
VQNGHKKAAESIIQKGVCRTKSIRNRRILSTALYIAAEKGLDEIICLLLDHGAHVEAKDVNGQTALYYAITARQEKTVKLLLERGASISYESSRGQTMAPMVHSAAAAGNTTIYRILLDYGADPGARCQFGTTALHHAAVSGHNAMVQLLLDNGSLHVDVRDVNGDTPFRCAADAEHCRTVLLLLDRGADINAAGKHDSGNTALHVAAISGNATMACFLLDQGAKIEATNWLGRTPLLCATASDSTGRIQVIRLLLDYGAKIDAKDKKGRTALHNAVTESRFRGDVTLISLLLGRGADINARDYKLQTPLHHAANSQMERIYQILKDCGADETARDRYDQSPKEYIL